MPNLKDEIDFEEQETRCQRVLDAWAEPLGIGSWFLTMTYHQEEKTEKEDGPITVATCSSSWEYFTLHLDIYLPIVACLSDANLEYWLIHELCHGLVCELREPEGRVKHEERVVSSLAMAFRWVRNAAVDGRLPRVAFTLVKDADRPDGKCYDCRLAYDAPGWIEIHVPDDVWAKINPTKHGGRLCANCIATRCAKLGLENVPITITAGPLRCA